MPVLTQLLNPFQVFDIDEGGPELALLFMKNNPHFRLIIAGGDGTYG